MPLRLPNLDDLRWKELVAEGRSLIPASAGEWTNHNPSDPGITLVELFAYVSETLIYQLNRITDGDTAAFLSLLNGSGWKWSEELAERDSSSASEYRRILRSAVSSQEKRDTLQALSTPARAITPEDFDFLVRLVTGAERTETLPRLNLENVDTNSRWQDAPGHISVVVLAASNADAPQVLANVRESLEPARLLTTRVHVVGSRFLPITIQLSVVAERDVHDIDALRKSVIDALTRFLDPRTGWFDRGGWPFGRNLSISELWQIVGEIHGVYGLVPNRNAHGDLLDEISVDALFRNRLVRNESGAIQEFVLLPDELFEPKILAENITITRHA
jgi:hypothetical protein